MGGGVSAYYASLYSNEIKTLVLVDAKISKRIGLYFKLGKILGYIFEKCIEGWWVPVLLKKLMITVYLGVPWEDIRKDKIKNYSIMECIQKRSNEEFEIDYTKLKMPLLLIWGSRDTWITPIDKAKEIHKQIKRSKMIIVKGGHTILYQKPKEVVTLIIRKLFE